jgi:catechol 2,3-dioxygenase-like lactoylglutathione lyase family enzyme
LRQVTEPLEVPGERVKVCFVEAPPGVLIELVEGLGDKSPVADVVARTGAGPYHICYRVADLDDAVRRLRAEGCFRIKRFERPAVERRGGDGEAPKRFAFLLTPDRQLFELCEAERREEKS